MQELGRPRIDVTTRISGFFRDAFPHLIELIDHAVNLAIEADESIESNFIRKHYLSDIQELSEITKDAEQRCRFRVFGSKPGSYGAGILPLIQERNWKDSHDFAEAYINWGGFAYTASEGGIEAREEFKSRLSKVQVALHNQDNREHDIYDSDDYLQFHGGMIATVFSLTGQRPKHYFGDSHDPSRSVVRDLKEESLRVFRSRVVNPKWINGIKRHGYKGGLELAATVDYMFGYDATCEILEDWMYETLAQEYTFNQEVQEFLEQNNPWALNAICERLLEAASRGMWAKPKPSTLERLKEVLLRSETMVEERGEKVRVQEAVN